MSEELKQKGSITIQRRVSISDFKENFYELRTSSRDGAKYQHTKIRAKEYGMRPFTMRRVQNLLLHDSTVEKFSQQAVIALFTSRIEWAVGAVSWLVRWKIIW